MNLKIERLDDTGRGIGYINNKVTFVPKTVVGDLVSIKIEKEKAKYNEAVLEKIIDASKDRITPKCPFFAICGGCDLQNISYEKTIDYKKNKVKNAFLKNKIIIEPEFIENENSFNYRNKITLKVVDKKIGYYEAKTHKLIEIDKCLIAAYSINETISLLKNLNITNGEVVIRSNYNNEILLWINSLDKINIDINKIKEKIKLCGIVVNDKTIYGDNFIYEKVNNIIYKVSYDSFFQVNLNVASKLFNIVAENIEENDEVIDLYSGVGTLSLTASKKASSVIGVEIVPNAVLNSTFNASINKIDNALFMLNDASRGITKIEKDFNTLIVDPPRSGLSKEIIEVIKNKLPKKIIYVSCDMHTLIRDIKLLEDIYEIKKLYTLDMFSYTYHVEDICILNLK